MKLSKKTQRVILGILFMTCLGGQAVSAEDVFNMGAVDADKVWNIEFTQKVDDQRVKNMKFKLIDGKGNIQRVSGRVTSDGKNLKIDPPNGGYIEGENYTIVIPKELRSAAGESLKEDGLLKFSVEDDFLSTLPDNFKISYEDYDTTVDEFVRDQMNQESAIKRVGYTSVKATLDEVKYYIDPENFMDDYGIYQFMSLNYMECLTVEQVDEIFKGKGMLEGKGVLIIEGAKMYNVNPAYILAHTYLETGGSSALASGIEVTTVDGKKVEPRVTYNMFGIGAHDGDSNRLGSEYAYKQGWFTPEIAILEGIQWIGKHYINSDKYKQNTLYEMKWNHDVIWHQYSTDVEWAYKQIKSIKKFIPDGSEIIIEIPRYEK